MKRFDSPKEYIAAQPATQRALLKKLRAIILEEVPGAEEIMSYNMPAFRANGLIAWYASYSNHIGFYPKASVIKAFETQLEKFQWSKGTVRLPLDKKLPESLIRKMIRYRLQEMKAKRE
jgi:uncharacterized protein YdhG (YjbR/CyaY superfamily)